jgi:Lipopolysaccharide-assembly
MSIHPCTFKMNLSINNKPTGPRHFSLVAGILAIPVLLFFISTANTGCFSYKFKDIGSIPDSIKTVKVNFIENRARYVNPQLSPRLTDKVRQKITGQTKLVQTNGDNPDWEISGEIRDYSVTTSGISNQQEATNRLSVTVHIVLIKRKQDNLQEEFDVTRNYDFSANQSLQQAEARLSEEMIRTLTDEIFNRIFSNW